MATITTRAGKGSPLSSTDYDNTINSLNDQVNALSADDVNVAGLVADLRALDIDAVASTQITTGVTVAGTGGGTWRKVTGAAPGTYVDNVGTIIVPTGGDGGKAWLRYYSGAVDVKWFGAVGDGVADDSAAVQAAITYALANDLDLEVTGMCRLASSVNIDRQVDGAAFDKFFKVFSRSGGGFYVTTNINMISSTIAFSTSPVSQLVLFDGLNFESDTASTRYVLDNGRFLRSKFHNCSFSKILGCASTIYTQSVQFDGCNMRRGNGTFFSSANQSYDFKFRGNIVEAWTGDFLNLAAPIGCAITDDLLEGITGTAIVYNGAQGIVIHGNYFENNGLDIDGTGSNVTYGLSLLGNYFSHSPSNQYSVIWGAGGQLACVSEGNWHTGSMHSITTRPLQQQLRINDIAQTSLWNVATQTGSDPFFDEALVAGTGHYLPITTAAGWTAAVVGSGSTGQQVAYNFTRTGTTLNSTARLYTETLGGFANTSLFGINYSKALIFRFNLARATTEANAVGRVQLKTTQAEGAMAAAGLGIRVLDFVLAGESYGSSGAFVDLATTLADANNYEIEIRHYPAQKVEWWVNGVLKGTQSTAANIPSGTQTAYMVNSLTTATSNPSGDAQMFVLQPSLWVAR